MARTADQLTASEEVMIWELNGIANNTIVYKDNSGVMSGIEIVTSVVTTGWTTTLTSPSSALEVSWTLVSNATIVVPNRMAPFVVDNTTTGAYTLTVKTLTGIGVVVSQSTRVLLYANGTDVELGASGSAGSGDMVLASTQTVSGLKTFLAWMFALRNVANTFSGLFTNTNTADRTYTLQNRNGTLADDTDLALKASTTLSNLWTVAINTSLVSDTDNTDDLGTTAKKWANLFVTTIGATATRVTKGWFTDIESTNMPTVGGVAIVPSPWTSGNVLTSNGTAWTSAAPTGGASEIRIRIPGEMVADTANYQGVFWRNTTGATITISNVKIGVAIAAAGAWAAAAFNVYKSSWTAADGINTNAVNLFTSAVDLTTNNTDDTNVPDTATVEDGRWISLRCTSSAGATNKASDCEVVIAYS